MEANEEAEEEVVRLAAAAHFQQKRANVYFCAPILSPLHRASAGFGWRCVGFAFYRAAGGTCRAPTCCLTSCQSR